MAVNNFAAKLTLFQYLFRYFMHLQQMVEIVDALFELINLMGNG